MKAYTTSLACEAPVLFTVLVTVSAGLGSRGCPTPACRSALCPPSIAPHTFLNGVAVRLDLGDSAHRWAVGRPCCLLNSLVKPFDGRSPGQPAWWHRSEVTRLPLAMELPRSLWKPALGGVLLHPKCKHGETLHAGKYPVLAGQLPNPAKVLKERDTETPFWSTAWWGGASLPHTLVLWRFVQNGLLSLPSFLCKILLTAVCVLSMKLPILAQQNGLFF